MSFAATLGMRSLGTIAQQQGRTSNDLGPLYDLIQNNAVGAFLKAHGYRYIHVGSWFDPTQSIRIADQNLFLGTTSNFAAVLDDTTFGPTLNQLIGLPVIPQDDAIHRTTRSYQFEALADLARAAGSQVRHGGHPAAAPPVRVQRGRQSYPTTQQQASRTETQKTEEQLDYANAQLRKLVTQLLSVPPDRQPIIVLAVDEGPYPDAYAADENNFNWSTATPDQLETKFGILYAMYLPGEAPAGHPCALPHDVALEHLSTAVRPVLRDEHPADAGPELLVGELRPSLRPDGHHGAPAGAPGNQPEGAMRVGAERSCQSALVERRAIR